MNIGGHARIAKSADQDGVEIPGQHGEAVRRDRNFVGEIAVGSPVERGEFDRGTSGLHHVHACGMTSFPMPSPGITAMRFVAFTLATLAQR